MRRILFDWSPERTELLRTLWKQGFSASQIARRMGGLTRSAVIGKVHRIGLAGRTTPDRPARAIRPRRSSKGVVVFKRKFKERPAPNTAELAAIRALKPIGPALPDRRAGQCRYIRDEPGSAICGRFALGSWCDKHRKLVFVCARVEAAEMAVAA